MKTYNILLKRVSVLAIITFGIVASCLAQNSEINNAAMESLKTGEYEKAVNKLTEILIGDSQNKEIYYYRAIAYSNLEDLQEATSTYVNPTERPPSPTQLSRLDKIASKNVKNIDLAIADLTKAIELDNNYINAYNYRAIMYYLKKDYDNSLADVKKVKELGSQANPKFLGALLGTAMREGKINMDELSGKNQ